VKEDIRENFKYVFVDEFQDSSPTQVKMFEKLSAIVGRDEDDDYKITIGKNTFNLHNSVWVGDFKQAIYGFRGADTALTKAVADIIEANMKTNPRQFSLHTLDTSYRSYQQIVDKTNEIFEYSFSGILSPENVHLNHNRAQPANFGSLRTWTPNGNNESERIVDLCARLEKLVLKTRDPSKIAVLARKKAHYDKIINELRKRNIPVSIETEIEPSCDEVQLIIALLRLVINPYDAYSRALVTFLTEKDFDAGKVIDSKLDFSENYKKAKEKGEENLPEYLSKKTIISKFMEKKSVFSSQTIHSLVESLIIELDLFNLCRNWDSAEISDVILQALIDAAGKYEELCAASAIPPTISGYIAYISDKENLKSGGSKNGIVFMTIHKSKGLEWDHVILLSLKADESEIGQFIKHEVFGVSFYHKDAPSSENLYPPMIVNLFPYENVQKL
jgi:ATP-dependent exoDNAse (exonuclease V) beta subunit